MVSIQMIRGVTLWPILGDIVAMAMAMAATLLVTRYILAHAIRRSILDIPNARSSHNAPTPRGGGAAIALVVLAFILFLGLAGLLSATGAIAFAGGGVMVAVVGWLDDRHSVSAGVRALVHIIAAVWAVAWLGWLPSAVWGQHMVHLGPLGGVLAVIAIVWATNFYNFMDGIDGLASTEAVTAGGTGALLLTVAHAHGLALLSAAVAGAAAGFLIWNWTPARIFMGDVGSGFLGFSFGAFAVASERTSTVPWYVWVILLLAFAGDATATLIRRVAHGEPWYTAHRLHAYQRLVQSGLSHAQVVIRILYLNLLLAALAVVVFVWPALAWPGILLAFLIVTIAYAAVEHRLGMWTVTQHTDPKVLSSTSRTN